MGREEIWRVGRAASAIASIGLAAMLSGCVVAGGALIYEATRHAAMSKVTVPVRGQYDTSDKDAHDAAFDKAVAEPGSAALRWTNPATGDSGTIEAAAAEPGAGGQECRQVKESYAKAGKTYDGASRFCRSGSGEWQLKEG